MPYDHYQDMAKYVFHVDKQGIHYLTEERPMPDKDPFKEVEHKETVGKFMAGVIEDLLPALKEVAEMQAMNIKPVGKYERGSWMTVPKVLYIDAFYRHLLAGPDTIDTETGKPHDVAIAWNALVRIWFRLKEEGKLDLDPYKKILENLEKMDDQIGIVAEELGKSKDHEDHGM